MTILGMVAALLLLGATETALSQAVESSPRSDWQRFPLAPGLQSQSESTARSRATEEGRKPPSQPDGSPSGGLRLPLIGAALVIAGILGVAAVHMARRMSPVAERKHGRPPQRAAIVGAPPIRVMRPERKAHPSGSPPDEVLAAHAAASIAPSPAPAGVARMEELLLRLGLLLEELRAPLVRARSERGAAGRVALEPGADAERCEVAVARWRNRAWFYARRAESDTPIAASPEFPVRRRHPLPLTPEAVAALEVLTEGLERLGWSFAGQGPAWFGRQFVRPNEFGRMPGAAAARRRRS